MIYRKTAKDPAIYMDLTPYEYEEYVRDRLKAAGWRRIKVTDRSGDFGADIVGDSPTHHRVAIQAKRYVNKVGVDAVSQAIAGMSYYHCTESMVITSAPGFTASAIQLANESKTMLWSNFEITKTLNVSFKDRTSHFLEQIYLAIANERAVSWSDADGWHTTMNPGLTQVNGIWALVTDGKNIPLTQCKNLFCGKPPQRASHQNQSTNANKIVTPNARLSTTPTPKTKPLAPPQLPRKGPEIKTPRRTPRTYAANVPKSIRSSMRRNFGARGNM